jgi:hypothetical protein
MPLPDYDRSILYPAQSVFRGCSSKIGADEVDDDEKGEDRQVHDDELLITDQWVSNQQLSCHIADCIFAIDLSFVPKRGEVGLIKRSSDRSANPAQAGSFMEPTPPSGCV